MRRGATPSGWSAGIKTWWRSRRIRSLRRGRLRGNSPPAGSGDPARSLRLGALLHLYRGSPADALARRDELDPDELDALGDLTEDDMHLANACLEVDAWSLPREVRRELRLVERALAADLFGEGELVKALETGSYAASREGLRGMQALMRLGLLDVEPDPDDEQ